MHSRTVVRTLAIAAVALCVPVRAMAQEPARTLDQLQTVLKPGDTVWVVDAKGRELKGKIRELSATTLELDSWGRKTLRTQDVQLVKQKNAHHFWMGALIGGAVGAGLGFATWAGPDGDEASGAEPLIVGGLGAGVGVGFAALIPRKELVVYRAAGSSKPVKVSVAPLSAPRTRGISLRFVW